jgi:hypothetical protein
MRSRTAILIGGGRVAVGLAFALNPVLSISFLGVDSATARRLSWLAQMTAARDIAIGAGTVWAGVGERDPQLWLVAGAVCDAADAAAIGRAAVGGHVSRTIAAGVVAGAAAASAVALAATIREFRQPNVTPVT